MNFIRKLLIKWHKHRRYNSVWFVIYIRKAVDHFSNPNGSFRSRRDTLVHCGEIQGSITKYIHQQHILDHFDIDSGVWDKRQPDMIALNTEDILFIATHSMKQSHEVYDRFTQKRA